MDEAEWLASEDPAAMLEWLNTPGSCGGRPWSEWKPSEMKLRLFAVACSRLHAYGWNGWEEWAERDEQLPGTFLPKAGARYFCGMKIGQHPALTLSREQRTGAAHLLREIVGNPFRPVTLDVDSVEGLAIACSLAHAAYDHRDPATGHLDPVRLAILADALEEAGCPQSERCAFCGGKGSFQRTGSYAECPRCANADGVGTGSVPHPLLAHLRSTGPHVRGCWALDLILAKE